MKSKRLLLSCLGFLVIVGTSFAILMLNLGTEPDPLSVEERVDPGLGGNGERPNDSGRGEAVTFGGDVLTGPGLLLTVAKTPGAVNSNLLAWQREHVKPPNQRTFGSGSPLDVRSRMLDASSFVMTPLLIEAIRARHDVDWLRINCEGTRESVNWTRHLKHLKGLSIVNMPGSQLKSLPNFRRLKWLHLDVSGDADVQLPSLPELEVLLLCGGFRPGNVGDRLLPAKGQLASLRALSARYSELTDAGIAKLVLACPNLEYLNIAGSRAVTPKSIDSLVRLESLKYLHVGTTGITGARAARLKAEMPTCDVRFGS